MPENPEPPSHALSDKGRAGFSGSFQRQCIPHEAAPPRQFCTLACRSMRDTLPCVRQPVGMSIHESFRVRLPAWSDWFSLAFISVAAPAAAACIHSVFVFHRGFRLYNAEIGGPYFSPGGPNWQPGALTILHFSAACCIPTFLSFLVLLPFRKRTLYRWLVWLLLICLWTWLNFKMEYAYH